MSNQTPSSMQPAAAEVDGAFAALAKYDRGSGRAALLPLDTAVAAASAHRIAREEMEARLLQALPACKSNVAREYVCSKLALVGGKASVSALAGMLPHPEISAAAATALEAIGSEAAKEVRKTLPTLTGLQQAGAAYLLGVLRDAASVGSLSRLLHDSNPAVATAAAIALGNLGTPSAARELRAFAPKVPVTMRPKFGDACLVCAAHLSRAGKKQAALGLKAALRDGSFPKHIRDAASA